MAMHRSDSVLIAPAARPFAVGAGVVLAVAGIVSALLFNSSVEANAVRTRLSRPSYDLESRGGIEAYRPVKAELDFISAFRLSLRNGSVSDNDVVVLERQASAHPERSIRERASVLLRLHRALTGETLDAELTNGQLADDLATLQFDDELICLGLSLSPATGSYVDAQDHWLDVALDAAERTRNDAALLDLSLAVVSISRQPALLRRAAVCLIARDKPDAAQQAWRRIALSDNAEPDAKARAARNVCHIAINKLNRSRLIQSLAAESNDSQVRAICIEALADGAMTQGLTSRAVSLYSVALSANGSANKTSAVLAAKYASALIDDGRTIEAVLFVSASLESENLTEDERTVLTLAKADALAANNEIASAKAVYLHIAQSSGRFAERAMDSLIRLNAKTESSR